MTRNAQFLMVLGTLALALTASVSLTYPAIVDSQREHEELTRLKVDLRATQEKLSEKARLDALSRALQTDIDGLRNAVPKAPYLDLVTLDLDHLAKAAQIDIVGIEQPEKKSGQTDTSDVEDMLENKVKLATTKPEVRPPVKANEVPAAAQSLGVKQVTRRMYLTGSYDKLINFMKSLEGYQRVLSVKDLSIATFSKADAQTDVRTEAVEKAQKLKLKEPVMSFLLNVYYLP